MKERIGRKGFTLVEILAVIVILAIILMVAVPAVTSIITSSTKNAFESEAKKLLKNIEYRKIDDPSFEETSLTANNISDVLGLPVDNYETITVSLVDGVNTITIEGKGKWAGLYACGTFLHMDIYTSADECAPAAAPPVNAPVLATGMTPIKWVNGVETTTTANDTTWYDYVNKLWANAKTADGSYWVWVPRYAYSITSGYHSGTTGTIEVKFLNGTTNNMIDGGTAVATTPTYSGNSQTNYVLHPAFNFGGTQVTGMWIAKFEASDNGGKVKIIPNVESWGTLNVASMYNNSRSMETDTTYGWGNTGTGIDTHMMKNTEWGVATYLSKSVYGINNEIWVNPANNFTTGCAGNSVSSNATPGCLNTYDTTNGQKASTTGNITGIYDMSGGSWEYVMGNLDNEAASSGLTPSSIPDKYIDRYSAVNNGYTSNYFGDAYYETSNAAGNYHGAWYSDYTYTITSGWPWFIRGGDYTYNVDAGAFSFYRWSGASNYYMFRPVLMVATGL